MAHNIVSWYQLVNFPKYIYRNKISPWHIIKQQPNEPMHEKKDLVAEINTLAELKEAVTHFKGLDICLTAKNTVFSDGIENSKIMLIGEAPGAREDEMGIPFCGPSGKLLDLMMESIGLSRKKNIYITNSVFWRPPANRKPTNEEIAVCRPFLEKHIALIEPQIIILVGSVALSSVLENEIPMNVARNTIYSYHNKYLAKPISTFVIFHPSYLLRQPSQKKAAWFDLLKIRDFMQKLPSIHL